MITCYDASMVSSAVIQALIGPTPPRPANEMWCGESRVTGCRRVHVDSCFAYDVFIGEECVGRVTAPNDFVMTSMDGFGLPFV